MWQGANYNSNLDTKEIAKIVRKQLKEKFPMAKWSITTDYSKISVTLMEYDKEIVNKEKLTEGYANINHYQIERNRNLSNEGKALFIFVRDLVQSYNYNDSDVMRDYFDYGFFFDLSIGKWDKPFQVVNK